jgi:hypothetical protein
VSDLLQLVADQGLIEKDVIAQIAMPDRGIISKINCSIKYTHTLSLKHA